MAREMRGPDNNDMIKGNIQEIRMINTQFNVSRRRFLASAGTLAATSSLPSWFAQECAAQEAAAPVKEDLRLALIGAGGRGTVLAREASRFGKIVAVCDVDANHVKRAQGLKQCAGAAGYEDFRTLLERKDVDAVICGTVDHWHRCTSGHTGWQPCIRRVSCPSAICPQH